MHKEILTDEQQKLLRLVKSFSRNFGLVGGTAIALQIGHRRSVDFDLFSNKSFSNAYIKSKISKSRVLEKVFKDEEGQYTFHINGVQFTFFHYPYPLDFSKKFEDVVRMPDLLTLAAMKAFALGRRAKWKDYVDLYFIMEKYHGIGKIIKKTKQLFGSEFNEKIIRSQLTYFDDINYSEEVEYLKGFEVSDEVVKKKLIEFSLMK